LVRTNRGNRLHIGIFGKRNAGKSSLINALTNQDIALVSDVAGTTTDPVFKSMELLPVGPVVIIDTAGMDDEGELGEKRVEKSRRILARCDFVIIVISAEKIDEELNYEKDLVKEIKLRNIPVIIAINKTDLKAPKEEEKQRLSKFFDTLIFEVSSKNRVGIEELKKGITQNTTKDWIVPTIVGDLIRPGDVAVLVCPIDNAAPKGRLILPQVATIRDILDNDAQALVVKERELAHSLRGLKNPPTIVITDSQEFQKVSADCPPHIPMTSFSILFARYKGELETFIKGIKKIKKLEDGDTILISEACTHHAQSDDIGRVKIPRWLRQLTGKELKFEHSAGSSFPDDMTRYSLVVHCGACMINRREMLYRMNISMENNIPIVNYGMLIAYVHGILQRALTPFPMALAVLNDDIY